MIRGARVGTLFLSPHPDDVAFSLGGSIERWAPPRVLCTVFSRVVYTADEGLAGDVDHVSALRAEEDRAFSAARGMRYLALGLDEAPLRLGRDFEVLRTGETTLGVDMLQIGEVLCDALRRAIVDSHSRTIVAPLAYGGHRDHVVVREAACRVAAEGDCELVFYEDLPYATDATEREIREHVRRTVPGLQPLAIPVLTGAAARLEGARLYRSQFDGEIERAMLSFRESSEGLCERVWTRGRVEIVSSPC